MEWINKVGDWVNVGLFGSPVATIEDAPFDVSIVDVYAAQLLSKIDSLFGVLPPNFSIIYAAAAMVGFIAAVCQMMMFRSVRPVWNFGMFYCFLMVTIVLSNNWTLMADGWTGWLARLGYGAFGWTPAELTP